MVVAFLPVLRKVSLGLAWGYFFSLLLLRALWEMLGESHWILVITRFAPAPAYFGVLLLIFLFDFALRRSKSLAPAALSFLFITTVVGSPVFPLSTETAAPELTAVSYNVRAGLAGGENIGNYLDRQKADVICLQEARAPLADPKKDPVPILTRKLKGYHRARGGSRGELVTYSKFPILSVEERTLDEKSRLLDVSVETPKGRLRILNVHVIVGSPGGLSGSGLEHSARARHTQARAMTELIKEGNLPTLLLGDFNTPPGSEAYRILSQELQDAFAQAGFGFGWTFPTRLPGWRIDFIWSRGLRAASCTTGPRELSDHRPVIARLIWGD